MPFKMYWPRLVFREIHCFVHWVTELYLSFISPPSFMFVGAACSEICELNWNKEEKEKKKKFVLLFNTFPGHSR